MEATIQLKQRRDARGLSRRETAELLKITESYYGMLEIGDRRPSLALASRMAVVFNVSLDDIVQCFVFNKLRTGY